MEGVDVAPARVPLGARLILWAALGTWLAVRLPSLEQSMLRLTDAPASLAASDLPVYLAMGDALLRSGRLGQYDPARVVPVGALANPGLDIRSLPVADPPDWKTMDYNDWGFEGVVALAWLLPAPHGALSILVLQHAVDLSCLLLVAWIGWRLVSPWAGACAALTYAVHPSVTNLAGNPYYYYWNHVVCLTALAVWVAWLRDPGKDRRGRSLLFTVAVGAVLGAGILLRATNQVLLPLFWLFLFLSQGLRRWTLLLAVCMTAAALLILTPVVLTKYHEHGRVQLAGKEVFWHTILCGVGLHDNPWGLQWDDALIMARIRDRHGVAYDPQNMRPYDQACKREVLALWRENPGIFLRNVRRNLIIGLKDPTALHPEASVPSVRTTLGAIRWLAMLGFVVLACRAVRLEQPLRYWLVVLAGMFLLPIATIAPIAVPNLAYSSGLFAPEVLLAGIALGEGLSLRSRKVA